MQIDWFYNLFLVKLWFQGLLMSVFM